MPLLTLILSFLKKIPAKDLLYSGALVAAFTWFLWYSHHERAVGAANQLAAVTKASDDATKKATTRVDELTAAHAKDLSEIEDRYETLIQKSDAAHDDDLARLRKYEAGSGKTPTHVESSAVPDTSADLWKGRFARLGDVSAELAVALRKDDAALESCYAERDFLTGKP